MIILHVPHASRVIPPEVRAGIVLSDAELNLMTDSFTDVIAQRVADALAVSGVKPPTVVAAPVSRLVVDVERFTDGSEPMEAVGMGPIYTRTHDQRVLRDSVDAALLDRYFHPHALRMTNAVDSALAAHGSAVVIDVHSYPTERLPYELALPGDPRPQICLGVDPSHTPDWLLGAAREAFADYEVEVNTPFAGAYVPLKHYGRVERVTGIMIEIRRDQYLDEETVVPDDGVERIARCVAALAQGAVQRSGDN